MPTFQTQIQLFPASLKGANHRPPPSGRPHHLREPSDTPSPSPACALQCPRRPLGESHADPERDGRGRSATWRPGRATASFVGKCPLSGRGSRRCARGSLGAEPAHCGWGQRPAWDPLELRSRDLRNWTAPGLHLAFVPDGCRPRGMEQDSLGEGAGCRGLPGRW